MMKGLTKFYNKSIDKSNRLRPLELDPNGVNLIHLDCTDEQLLEGLTEVELFNQLPINV